MNKTIKQGIINNNMKKITFYLIVIGGPRLGIIDLIKDQIKISNRVNISINLSSKIPSKRSFIIISNKNKADTPMQMMVEIKT